MEKQTNKKRKKIVGLGILALLAIVIFGYKYVQEDKYESTDNAQIDGNILPIKAGITGYVARIYFTDNSYVHKGDTLIVFNTDELRLKEKEVEAALLNAQATIGVSENRILAGKDETRAAQLSVQAEQEQIQATKAILQKAKSDLERTKKLYEVKAVTEAQLEDAQKNFAIATANNNSTLSHIKSLHNSANSIAKRTAVEQKEIIVTNALVEQRRAALGQIRETIKSAFILASFNGIITKRAIQVGQYVNTGQSLCALIETDNLWVTANVKETQLKNLKQRQQVEIIVDAFPNAKLQGSVESFGGATGGKFALVPPDNSTGNFIKITQRFPIRIKINNKSVHLPFLYPGLSASVNIKIH
jgi:membrane fusion protein (multidrug efflux system)